jgi:acyl-CoA thioesterase-1
MRRLFLSVLLFLAASSAAFSATTRGSILVFGDSLSAAYGLGQKEGWVALLEERLRRNGHDYTVVNASISGETTSGGASRIGPALARTKPAVVIIELGGNDGLRGLPVKQMRENLSAMVAAARKAGSRVLIVSMRMPPNYGPGYTKEFDSAFREVARQHKVALVPFFPDGVGEKREMFQDDQIHPTAAAQPVILEQIWKALRPLL